MALLPVIFSLNLLQVDVAPAEAVEVILEQIQQILIAASSGHCITGLEPQTMEGPLYTLINTESEVQKTILEKDCQPPTHLPPTKAKEAIATAEVMSTEFSQ